MHSIDLCELDGRKSASVKCICSLKLLRSGWVGVFGVVSERGSVLERRKKKWRDYGAWSLTDWLV